MGHELEPLERELRSAEATLKSTLDEACSANAARADTGELIRIEEMLAIASDAAKRAISIRRRRSQARNGASASRASRPSQASPDTHGGDKPAQRDFVDGDGAVWTVWPVHPADRPDARHSRLLGSYQQGWLAFECDRAKRRLSPIPDGWQTMDDAALCALLAQAQEAAPRRADDTPGTEE